MIETQLPLLTADCPIPIDRPFTRAEARAEGVSDRWLRANVDAGLLISPIAGVYHAAQIPDGIDLRVACVKLVAPEDAVVTDRTAGWIHGASMILRPNEHKTVPRVCVFLSPGNRLRNKLAESGERTFLRGEVVEIDGLRLTSKLRTTCDLGRNPNRYVAFSAMDRMMAVADFDLEELAEQGRRFKGYRYVRQFRGLVPWVDGRSGSPPESVMRLRWLDCSDLPRPELQVPVDGPDGICYLDLGVPELRYSAEYDGVEWHGPDRQQHDRRRRDWVRKRGSWLIDVFGNDDLYSRTRSIEGCLRTGLEQARRRLRSVAWTGRHIA